MTREYPQHPIVGVGGVVVDRDRVLLVRRARPPLQGEWSIPGGAVETGESLIAALTREMLEETGLTVMPLEVIEVLDRIQRDERGRAQYHYVLIDYLCTVESGVACAASDAAECAWVSRDDLDRYGLTPDTRTVIEKALRRSR